MLQDEISPMEVIKPPRGWCQHQSLVSHKKEEDNFSPVEEIFLVSNTPSRNPQWTVHHQDFMEGQNHHQNTFQWNYTPQ